MACFFGTFYNKTRNALKTSSQNAEQLEYFDSVICFCKIFLKNDFNWMKSGLWMKSLSHGYMRKKAIHDL